MATSYNIYESTTSTGSGQADGGTTLNYFDSVDSTNPGTTAPATTNAATGLTAGTTPQFYVTAIDASGESAASNTVVPAVPTGVASVIATPGADGSSATEA